MNRAVVVSCIVALNLSVSVRAADNESLSPEEQYRVLLKEYNPVSGGLRKATTDLQRKDAVERLSTFPAKFVALAEETPRDPVALKILRQAIQALGSADSATHIAWETNRGDFPSGPTDNSADRIVALILQHHVDSDKLGPIIDRARYAYRLQFEKLLQTVMEKNPHREIQGLACLALAQFLNDRLRVLRLAEDRPELAKRCDVIFGKDYWPQLHRMGQANLAMRAESLFARAATDYGDVKFRNSTVGEQVKSELFEIR